jgi:Leucine-rich repeat (LRR) protein
LAQIRTLYLADNLITTLGANQFASMTSVESLRLCANRISFLEEHWTNGLSNLVNLDLNDNLLSSLYDSDFDGLPNLQVLSLCNNGFIFWDVYSSPFSSLPVLNKLDLSDNPIGDSWSYYSFLNLNSLKYLWLRNCSITTIDTNMFDYSSSR